jgi:hypothetical protein
MAKRAEAVARVGPDTDGGGIERVGKAQGSRLELHEMHVKQGVYEQPASEIGGIAAHLPAVEAEQAIDGILVEIGMDEAAQSPEHQDIVV